jgi:hypothetical protein
MYVVSTNIFHKNKTSRKNWKSVIPRHIDRFAYEKNNIEFTVWVNHGKGFVLFERRI